MALHVGGHGGNPITGAGWPSYYFEDHAGYPQAFQAQVISLVFEGVFERFPTLKVVLQEGGFAWMPWLMWRMDGAWRAARDEVPHLRASARRRSAASTSGSRPSRSRSPSGREYFAKVWDDLDMDDPRLFATDYPHWDFDAPDRALPSRPRRARRASGSSARNARALYPRLAPRGAGGGAG